MAVSLSGDENLSDDDRALLERMRKKAAEGFPDRSGPGLAGGKQTQFPIGIRPDGSLNRVDDGAAEAD